MTKTQLKAGEGPEGKPKESYTPTPQERSLVENFYEERKKETPAPKMKIEGGENSVTFVRSHPDSTVAYALLAKALGTTDADFIVQCSISWGTPPARILLLMREI